LVYPYIQPLQTAALLGMKMCCWEFFWGAVGRRWNFNKNVVLEVIAEKMKICYLPVTYVRKYPK